MALYACLGLYPPSNSSGFVFERHESYTRISQSFH